MSPRAVLSSADFASFVPFASSRSAFNGAFIAAFIFCLGCGGGGGSGSGGDTASASGTLAFEPSAVRVAEDGYVYLLDDDSDRLFRWSIENESYAATIRLGPDHSADQLAYSQSQDRLYLAGRSGRIRRIDAPSGPSPSIAEYENLADGVEGMVVTGEFLGVRSQTANGPGANGRFRTFDAEGALAAISDRLTGEAPEVMTYRSTVGRLYSYGNGSVGYLEVDPTTGAIGTNSLRRSQGFESWNAPFAVSSTGNRITLGSGHQLNEAFETIDILPSDSVEGVYLDDESLLLMQGYDQGRQTRLEHRDATGVVINEELIAGRPVHVARMADKALVVTQSDRGRPQFTVYEKSDDGDGDGISYANDAFPLDPAASKDTDGDGAPDEWNPGQSRKGSTLGLELDDFPIDTACQNSNQALANDRDVCDIAGATPVYFPREVVGSEAGIVYLLGRDESRVFRWSALTGEHLNPIILSEEAHFLTFSERQNRLYVGYEDGRITFFDPALADQSGALTESHFRRLPGVLRSLLAVDDFLVVYGGGLGRNWPVLDDTGQIVEPADPLSPGSGGADYGIRLEFVPDYGRSNPPRSEVISLRPLTGPQDREASYFLPMTTVNAEIFHVATDGSRLAYEDGSFRETQNLDVIGRIPLPHIDALWFSNGSLAALRNWAGTARVTLWDAQRRPVDLAHFEGYPYALVEAAGRAIVVSRTRDPDSTIDPENAPPEAVTFAEYVPGVDGDGDGVPFELDAFPFDPASSVDSDHDGFPDRWNPGYSGSIVSSRFGIDAFPFDSACWVSAQAIPGQADVCDIESQVGNYRPREIATAPSGIVYLLNSEFRSVDRYSLADAAYLNPIRIDSSAVSLAYSAATDQLYIGYANGRIDSVEGGLPSSKARFFRTMRAAPARLLPVENFLIVYVYGTSGAIYYSVSPEGEVVDIAEARRGSASFAFGPSSDRIYHSFDGIGSLSNRIRWEAFDPTSGGFGNSREWRHDIGEYQVESPLRVAPNGSTVILATGNIFEGDDLDWINALPAGYLDARWLSGNRLATLTETSDGNGLARLWNADFVLQASHAFVGEPIALVKAEEDLAVVSLVDGRPTIYAYVPSDDSDADGVLNDEDAFPLDASAAIDSDGDGAPDAWNAGYGPEDSTAGLILDAFPNDPECQIPEHGRASDPLVCDIEYGIPQYMPADIALTAEGIVHAFSPENQRIYRWSIAENHSQDPIPIGRYAADFAYSAENNQLYISYPDGKISQINPRMAVPAERDFTNVSYRPRFMDAVGENLLVGSSTAPFSTGITHNIFDGTGRLRTSSASRRSSAEFEWSPGNNTIYYASGFGGGGPIEAQTLDPETRILGPVVRPPNISTTEWRSPIRVTNDGALVAAASGWFFEGATLERVGRLPIEFTDADWLIDQSLMTLSEAGEGNAVAEQWSSDRRRFDSWPLLGSPLRIVSSDAGVVAITMVEGKPHYQHIAPLLDGDEDGVLNGDDAFPSDPAASLDSDQDGAPDEWNAGASAATSTLGLTLDAFPFDATCQLPAHAYPPDPSLCDFARSIPSYEPDGYAIDVRGTVYFLDIPRNGGVVLLRRWSGPEAYHVPPIQVGESDGAVVTDFTYSAANDRLYFGYSDGSITQLDPNDLDRGEVAFASTSIQVSQIVAVDDHVFAADPEGVDWTHFLFSPSGGAPIATVPRMPFSDAFEWSSSAQALFYVSPYALNRAVTAVPIDLGAGTIGAPLPYDQLNELGALEPVRISNDGTLGVSRTGNIVDTETLAPRPGLPEWFVDGDWTAEGTFVAIRDLPSSPSDSTLVEEWSSDLSTLLETRELYGTPLRVLAAPGVVQVVLMIDGRPEVVSY